MLKQFKACNWHHRYTISQIVRLNAFQNRKSKAVTTAALPIPGKSIVLTHRLSGSFSKAHIERRIQKLIQISEKIKSYLSSNLKCGFFGRISIKILNNL
jgi:hypothetical protein